MHLKWSPAPGQLWGEGLSSPEQRGCFCGDLPGVEHSGQSPDPPVGHSWGAAGPWPSSAQWGLCAGLAPAQTPELEALLVALAAGTRVLRFSALILFFVKIVFGLPMLHRAPVFAAEPDTQQARLLPGAATPRLGRTARVLVTTLFLKELFLS